MELELKISCACHQAKIATCCQTPLVAPIAPKTCTGVFLSTPNPNLPSDLLSDHLGNTSFKTFLHRHTPHTVSSEFLIRYFRFKMCIIFITHV